jgi:hypothetical protein
MPQRGSLTLHARLCGGFGLRLGRLGVDYAFAPFGELGNVQRISASIAIP